jgi:hypothetical protein
MTEYRKTKYTVEVPGGWAGTIFTIMVVWGGLIELWHWLFG